MWSAGGHQGRHGRGHRAQLRRSELLHRDRSASRPRTRPAEKAAELLGRRRRRHSRLLDGPDRHGRRGVPAEGARRHDGGRLGAEHRRRRERRARDHDHRHGSQGRRRAPSATAGRSAAWRRARGCSRRVLRRCSSSSRPTPSSPPTMRISTCAPPTRTTFDRLDSDGAMSTNDQVTLFASGASGVAPDADAFRAALTDVCLDLATQLMARRGGCEPRHPHHGHGRGDRRRRGHGRPLGRPEQPVQDRRSSATTPTGGACSRRSARPTREFDPYDTDVDDERGAGVHEGRTRPPAGRRRPHARARRPSTIDLRVGDESATIMTNDLTHAYVHENSAYSS